MKRYSFFVTAMAIFIVGYGSPRAQFLFKNALNKHSVISNLSSMPLSFTENKGQWDSQALYKAEAGGAIFWFCKNKVVFQFLRDTNESLDDGFLEMPDGIPNKFSHPRHKQEQMVLTAEFVGANSHPQIEAADRLSYNCNYFIGNDPSKWATDVPNYSSITYKDLYLGIDLVYHGDGKGMKYDFIVNPGADISQIQIHYEGANILSVTNIGDLEASTSFGTIYEKIPVIYQEIDGKKSEIAGKYILKGNGIYGFVILGNYNTIYPVIIDPELVYSTYLGGSGNDLGWDISVNDVGAVYVTGETNSMDFPLYNPFDSSRTGGDCFVTKLSPSGSSLIYSTFIGGGLLDEGFGIGIDNSDHAYVTGYTQSNDFPLRNPYHPNFELGFLTKLSPMGDSLIYSTYLPISLFMGGSAIAVDSIGNSYITGMAIAINNDAFVLKMSPLGDSAIYNMHFGGSGDDWGHGITVDNEGCAYVIGTTLSADFPTKHAFQNSNHGGKDCFVSKISPSGDSLIYSTYLGGSGNEESTPYYGPDICIDAYGHAFVTGPTISVDFPTKNPFQDSSHGQFDAFVAKLSSGGDSLIYSTYLGGSGSDRGYSIAVDSAGNSYVTGFTNSIDFPLHDPYQNDLHGVFITKFSASGQSLVYSTYLGGNGEEGTAIVVDKSGNAFVTGSALTNFPMVNPFDSTYNGGRDAFVAKLGTLTDIKYNDNSFPCAFSLSQNYPNPFNAQTTISYSISKRTKVALEIFDIMGRRIADLSEGIKEPGNYQLIWDASGISSGIYFYRIKAGDHRETKRMTLIK